jgi:sarcosine oxidase
MNATNVRVAVVGAGINGLCAAWQLAQEFDGAEVVILDPRPAGHAQGSSHGAERIFRTSYETVPWVLAAARARHGLWPRLEADLGVRLLTPGPAVFWGPEEGPLPAYAAAVHRAGARVEEIDAAEARRRFPRMTFAGAERVLHDHDAGILAADVVMSGLDGWLRARGVTRLPEPVVAMEESPRGVAVKTPSQTLRCAAVVVAAGPWIGRLVPELARRVTPVRQHVGYWPMPVRAGEDPAWVHLGPSGLHYGLPTLAGGMMKSAFHRTNAAGLTAGDDPETAAEPDVAELASVEAHLAEWFSPAPGPRSHADTCFYTNAPDDTFILEEPVGSERILLVSACSGHAFKLAPVTGEAAARWAVKVAG